MRLVEKLISQFLHYRNFRGKRFLVQAIKRLKPENLYLRSNYNVILKENFYDLTWKLAFFGHKDKTVYEEVREIKRGSCFIDIGANYGIYSLIAAKLVGSAGIVISFEPNPIIFEYFISNIKKNKMLGRIMPFNLGISNHNQFFPLSFNSTHSGASHFTPDDESKKLQGAMVDGDSLDFLRGLTLQRNLNNLYLSKPILSAILRDKKQKGGILCYQRPGSRTALIQSQNSISTKTTLMIS